MLVTKSNLDFFSPLTGKNSQIVEESLISLYANTYGDDFSTEEVLARKIVRDIIYRVIQEIPWQEEENVSLENDKDKANYIIRRLDVCGWITFITDRGLSIRTFNFTKNGKKFAQMLYTLSDEDSVAIRQRNVRTTRASLEAYQKTSDPYDLMDAMTFSKHIVSDLTDNIHDLKEEKNELIRLAIEDISEASGKFISFLEDEFSTNLSVKFGEDSANRHRLAMLTTIGELLNLDESHFRYMEGKLLAFVPAYKDKENPLRNILYAIRDRLINACDSKLPQLKKEISTYIKRGEIIFRQTNTLVSNKNKDLIELAEILRAKPYDEKKDLLHNIGNHLGYVQCKILNLSSIRIRTRQEKKSKISYVDEDVAMPKEVYIQSQFEQQRHLAFNFTQKDIRDFIENHFEMKSQISNNIFEMHEPKDVLISLYATDIMYKNKKEYTFKYTGNRSKNIYFETDEYIIEKGGE